MDLSKRTHLRQRELPELCMIMDKFSKECGEIMHPMATVEPFPLMVDITLGNGKMVTCMARESVFNQMEKSMKVCSRTVNSLTE